MQITTSNTYHNVSFRANRPAAGSDFAPANTTDLVSIGNALESQERFDGGAFGKVVGGMMFGGMGAVGGAAGGALISAFSGASGWGVALSTVGGMVGGGLVGAFLGSR
jgi:hypothetical protein